MTPLGARIARLIEATGPVSLAEYMTVCMSDPRHGYYVRREAIGAKGDFVTAPQISQTFGEMMCIWCVAAWTAMDRPARFLLAEAGPGTGTLMADLLRAAARFPEFAAAMDVRLVETSPAMIERQRRNLAQFRAPLSWHASIGELPQGPLILVANEFLDVVPVRQYVRAGGAWRERCVAIGRAGALTWVLGAGVIDPALLPDGAEDEPDGAVFEISPAREAWVQTLAERLGRDGGMALLIDYGHAESGFGDTFQAMRGHGHADPLAEPGMADLTAHVDFARLARAARSAGIHTPAVVTQGEFLLAMGLVERAGQLGAKADDAVRERLRGEVERLAGPKQMGNLFKVMALSSLDPHAPGHRFPPFSAAAEES